MEIKLRNRSIIIQVITLLTFMFLVVAYAQLEWGLPQGVKKAALQTRGSILSSNGTMLARTVGDKRVYPQGPMAGQLLGMMGDSGGLEGLERAYNAQLSEGQDITVTIDPTIQATAERALGEGVRQHQGQYASAVVLEVRTGKIIAAASYPPFDPNHWQDYTPDDWRNHPFIDRFEPGSVIKGLTVASVLNDGLITPTTTYSTPMTRWVGGRWGSTIHDAVAHPNVLDTQGVLRYSSNVGISHIVEHIPNENLYNYLYNFGFGQSIDMPNMVTASGNLQPLNKWTDLVRTTNGFGQGMSTTTLQLAAAYNTLANDGHYVSPRLVEGESAGVSRNVVRIETSRTVRTLLRNVVRDGIPNAAGIQGFDLAGKTGTAQVVIDGKYSNNLYISTFAGFFPAQAPRITIAVMVYGAKKDYHGSMLAAPIYRDITAAVISQWATLPSQKPPAATPAPTTTPSGTPAQR